MFSDLSFTNPSCEDHSSPQGRGIPGECFFVLEMTSKGGFPSVLSSLDIHRKARKTAEPTLLLLFCFEFAAVHRLAKCEKIARALK